jgi:ribosomal protein L11 methyltransferase
MKWTEIKIRATAETEDLISNILYDVGATGLSIDDPAEILQLSKSKKDWDFIDASLLDISSEEIFIKAYFSESEDIEKKVKEIEKNIKDIPILNIENHRISTTKVDENDWAESWKKYYKPVRIGRRILIMPSWEEDVSLENDIVIELDPGMAFGTGTHETTMMCTEALEDYVKPYSTVYDIGTGSGILGIVAAKLGATKVVGVDLDPVCVKVANENIEMNNVEDVVEIKNGDLLEVVVGKADIIVSNIIAEIIAGMTPDLKNYLNRGGIFITSGIIIEKISLVEKALIENGFKILEIKKLNSWACIIATIE